MEYDAQYMPSTVWKGHLTFGLVSIPVKLYRAARRERVRMHYVHRPEVREEPLEEPGVRPAEVPARSAERVPHQLAAFTPTTAPEREPAPELPPPVTRVHQPLMTSTAQPIPRGDVLRGDEVEPDRSLVFGREELKVLRRNP